MNFELISKVIWVLLTVLPGHHVAQIVQGSQPLLPTNLLITDLCEGNQLPTFQNIPTNGLPYSMNLTYDQNSRLQNDTYWDLQSWAVYPNNCFLITLNQSNVNRTLYTNETYGGAQNWLGLQFKMRNQPDTYTYYYPVVGNSTEAPIDSIWRILNWTQTYSSAKGHIGYYQTGKDFVTVVRIPQGFSTSGLSNVANCTGFGNYATGPKKTYRFNCLLDEQPDYGSYQYLTVTHSFPFWMLTIGMLVFMVLTNYLEEDLEHSETLHTSIWMNYPLYTIIAAACYQTYPRRPRVTIVFFVCAAIYWYNAILNYRYMYRPDKYDIDLGIRLGALAVTSAVFGLIWEFIIGLLLVYYYKTNTDFLAIYSTLTDYEAKKHAIEIFEERNFQAIHVFYFLFLLIGLFFTITPIYFLFYHSTDNQAWWLLQGLIGIAWKYLFFDLILMFVARCACGRWTLWMRGYEFNYNAWLEWEKIKKYI